MAADSVSSGKGDRAERPPRGPMSPQAPASAPSRGVTERPSADPRRWNRACSSHQRSRPSRGRSPKCFSTSTRRFANTQSQPGVGWCAMHAAQLSGDPISCLADERTRPSHEDESLAHSRVRPAARSAATRRRADPRARTRRGARARAGDPAQPERPRAHHRRQHDGAARAAVQPRHGSDGRRRRVRRRRRGVARRARRRDDEGRERRLRRVRDLPGRLDVRDARLDPAARRGRAVLPVPSRVARTVRSRRAAARARPC